MRAILSPSEPSQLRRNLTSDSVSLRWGARGIKVLLLALTTGLSSIAAGQSMFGNALQFNSLGGESGGGAVSYPNGNTGTADHVNLGDIGVFGTSDFTIETWFNTEGGTATLLGGAKWSCTNTPPFWYLQAAANGTLQFQVYSATNPALIFSPAGSYNVSKWHHVAATRSATELKLYVDGVLTLAAPFPNPFPTGIADQTREAIDAAGLNDAPHTLLGGSDCGYLNGQLDETRIWSVARTQADIKADMGHELTVPQGGLPGLLAYYQYNQGTGGGSNTTETQLLDASGNGNHGTVANFALTGGTSNFCPSTAGVVDNAIAPCVGPPPPTNEAPVADAGGPYSGNEGSAIELSGATATDADSDPLTLSWAVDTSPTSATCTFSDASALNPDLTCTDNGSFTVTLTADDGTAPAVSSEATTVMVANVAPSMGAVTVPLDPININDQPVTGVSATYSDPGTADTHTCTVDYDDGTGPLDGMAAAGTCTGPGHTYTEAGVYTVTVEVTDDDLESGSSTAETMIVIYDPSGGFVTGGGWINSPEGAYVGTTLIGKASFGFVSKYKKGASVPTGNTEFQFKAGDLNFHSSIYDFLVITMGGTNAQYKGEGTINGSLAPTGANYKFIIWAQDNTPGGDDTFRIKIWYEGGEEMLVYDNGFDQAIGGGNIVVHTGKGGNAKTDELAEIPTEFALHGNYPNPFNPSTSIGFDLPVSSNVRLVVFDLLGREVARLVDREMTAGKHAVTWAAGGVPSGLYLYRIEADDFSQTRQMLLLK